jgi:hypothetical protein
LLQPSETRTRFRPAGNPVFAPLVIAATAAA